MTRHICLHGYFSDALQHCPWCHGYDASNADVVPVVGHGNGWLLRTGAPVCTSCGGPAGAGWGCGPAHPPTPPKMCYSCPSGENTAEAIAKRKRHTDRRGVRKVTGAK